MHRFPGRYHRPWLSKLLFFVLLFVGSSLGQIFVSSAGSDASDGSSISAAVFTLNRAIQLSSNGGSIVVVPGLYDWPTTQTISKPVSIRGENSQTVIITSSNLLSGVMMQVTASTGTVEISNITIDFSGRLVPSVTLVSSSSATVEISLDNVNLHCAVSLDSCTPALLVGPTFKAVSFSITGGGRSTLQDNGAGSFIRNGVFSFLRGSLCGGLRISSPANVFSIIDSTFSDSISLRGAGVCFSVGALASLSGVVCRNQTADHASCIHISSGCTVSITNSSFSDNVGLSTNVASSGGVMTLNQGAVLSISNSRFWNNTIGSSGSCIAALLNSTLTMDGCTFADNFALQNAAVLSSVSHATITDSVFSRNFLVSSPLTFSVGTAIVLDSVDQTVPLLTEISDCYFESNFVDASTGQFPSGAVYVSRRSLVLQNSVFVNNSAFAGSALTSLSSSGLIIRNCTFDGNEACVGGAVYAGSETASATTEISNSLFKSNRVYECRAGVGDVYGGAVSITGIFQFVNMSRNMFLENVADHSGTSRPAFASAVWINFLGQSFHIVSSHNVYLGNVARTGGFAQTDGYVVRVFAGQHLNVSANFSHEIFSNNSLFESVPEGSNIPSIGGALAVLANDTALSNAQLSVLNCSFVDNFAAAFPVFQFSNFHSVVRNSTFRRNQALRQGGAAAYTSDARTDIVWRNVVDNCVFEGNLDSVRVNSTSVIVSDLLVQPQVCPTTGGPAAELIIYPGNNFLSYNGNNQYYHVAARNCASIIFAPADQQRLGAEFYVPKPLAIDGAILDFRNVTAYARGLALLMDEGRTPSKIVIGNFNVTVGPSPIPLRGFLVTGAKNSSSLNPGKLILTSITEISSEADWSMENVDIVVRAPAGSIRLFGRFLDLNNCNILVEEGGELFFVVFSFRTVIRDNTPGVQAGSAIDVHGALTMTNGFFDRVNVYLHRTSITTFFANRFWPNSTVETTRGGAFEVNGKVTVDFKFTRFFEPPSLNEQFVVFNIPSRVESSALIFASTGGYAADAVSTPARLSFVIRFFTPLSVRISDDLAGIEVGFPIRTNSPPSRDCSGLLASDTLAALSPNVECAWQNANLLRVRAAMTPQTIQFVPSAISDSRNPLFYAQAPVATVVEPPLEPQPPVAIISTPSVVPVCSSWKLDASSSFRLGDGRNASFSWILVSPTNLALQNILESSPRNASQVTIPANILSSSVSYTFALNVTNSAGLSAVANWNVLASDLTLLVDVEGPQTRTTFSYLPTILHGRAEIQSGCLSAQASIDVRWTLPSDLQLRNVSLDTFSLEIDAFSLQPLRNYSFEWSAWPRGSPQLASRKTVTIVVISARISISVSGDVGLVPSWRDTTTSASLSDPDGAPDPTELKWRWSIISCPGYADKSQSQAADRIVRFLSLSSSTITDTITQSRASCLNATGQSFDVQDRIIMDAPNLVIPSNTFSNDVLFGVQVATTDGRVASKLVYLNFTSTGSFQNIEIDILGEQIGKILPQEKLVARALWNGQNKSPVGTIVRWGGSDTDPLINSSNLLTRVDLPTLVLKAGFLIPSQFYSLSILAQSSATGDVLGSNRIFFQANSAPSSGGVEIVSALNPRQLESFTVRAFGWVDVDVPLQYIFSLVSSADEVFLTELSDSPVATVVAPTAGNVILRVRVYDRLGSMSSAERSVIISSVSAAEVETLEAALLSSFSRFVLWGDIRSATTYGVALMESKNARNDAAIAIRQTVISSLATVASRRRLLWINSPSAINLLQSVTRLGSLSPDSIDGCARVLESIVAAAQTSSVASSYSISSSELAKFSTSGFLRAAGHVAENLVGSGVAASLTLRLQRVVESIVLLQSRFLVADELATNIATETLRAASVIVSNDTLAQSRGVIVVGGLSIGTSSWNSSTTINVINWASGVFPNAPSSASPVVQLLLQGAQVGNVSYAFESVQPGVCASYDAAVGEWDASKCRTFQSGQTITCECSASQDANKPILLSLLFRSDSMSPLTAPSIVAEVSNSSAGIVAGVVVGAILVVVAAGLIAIYAVPSLRDRFMPFASHEKQKVLADIELDSKSETAASNGLKWAPAATPTSLKV